MADIVAHPETGVPSRKVTSFVELDRAQLEQDVAENEAELNQLLADKRAAFEASLNDDAEVVAARSAVEESKSELSAYDQLTPSEPAPVEGAPVEDQGPAEDGSVSEQPGDGGEPVAVTVTEVVEVTEEPAVENADEY